MRGLREESTVAVPFESAHDNAFSELRLPRVREQLRGDHRSATSRPNEASGLPGRLQEVPQGLPHYGSEGEAPAHRKVLHAVLLP